MRYRHGRIPAFHPAMCRRASLIFFCAAIFFCLIFSTSTRASAAADTVWIILGDNATPPEKHAAAELARDFNRVFGLMPEIYSQADVFKRSMLPQFSIVVGTGDSYSAIQGIMDAANTAPLESEAFLIQPFIGLTGNDLLIAGGSPRGVLYGVYYYSEKMLGVDPYEYWTGREPEKRDFDKLPVFSHREKPPVFPLRGYFDNDDDMIANWKDRKLIIEFDTWKEMIDSLARLRYNYIDLHDTLGRAEFYAWPYYTSRFDYHTDIELVDQIINYAHEKGLMVQIPMYLGWEFHRLPFDKVCLSKYYDDWMDVYRYYLEESPLGKADLFLQRPSDPWWDHGYRCAGEIEQGIDPGPLMQRMFNGLLDLVNNHRPAGKVICDLWAEGRDMWHAGTFDPDKSIDMMWADGGYATYSEWPDDFKGHNFGIYIHAGYYLNHVMQDPYPARIRDATLEAVRRGMTHNYFVNGQDFKHFILNIEAAGRAAWDPEAFDPDAFYLEWTTRYFGAEAAPLVVRSLEQLHEAHQPIGGYTKITGDTVKLLEQMQFMTSQDVDIAPIDLAVERAEKSLELAAEAENLVPEKSLLVFDDQILFPATIFLENLKLHKATAETMRAFYQANNSELSKAERMDAKKRLSTWKKRIAPQLKKLRGLLEQGSKWKKWDGWTMPENFRKITPPPEIADVERIVRSLN